MVLYIFDFRLIGALIFILIFRFLVRVLFLRFRGLARGRTINLHNCFLSLLLVFRNILGLNIFGFQSFILIGHLRVLSFCHCLETKRVAAARPATHGVSSQPL